MLQAALLPYKRVWLWSYGLLAVVAILIAGASLAEHIFEVNLGIDEFFIKDNLTLPQHAPGRVSFFGAVCLLLIALGMMLQLSGSRKVNELSKALLNIVSAISAFILITYLFGIHKTHNFYSTSTLSVLASLIVFLISVAASLLQPSVGLASVFSGNKLGNQIARILFPLLLTTILVEGGIRIWLFKTQLVSEDMGIAILIYAFMITCMAIVIYVTVHFNKLDDERSAAMQQLELQNNELKQFAYIASHDLQEPLRTIHNYANLVIKEAPPTAGDSYLGYLQTMRDSTVRMSSLVLALLHYNRLGRKTIFENFELDDVWNEVLQDVKVSSEEAGAVITATPLPVIYGGKQEMRQLLQNLVSNALKFRNGEVPRIALALSEETNIWHFTVSDNGIGIDSKYHEKVFQMFQRLHNADQYEGSGIGLAYCKKIAELHHGEIWIENNAKGGCTIHFTIAKSIKPMNYA